MNATKEYRRCDACFCFHVVLARTHTDRAQKRFDSIVYILRRAFSRGVEGSYELLSEKYPE